MNTLVLNGVDLEKFLGLLSTVRDIAYQERIKGVEKEDKKRTRNAHNLDALLDLLDRAEVGD